MTGPGGPADPAPWLGVVADDVTGAADLAGEVAAAGLHSVLLLGAPGLGEDLPPCDCAVVALTTRTAPVRRAVEESAASARWLLRQGAGVLYQKYCSTFDSTDSGNIGPVADALADLLGGTSIGTPATPPVGRTQYLGHLFVGDRLLSESPLRDHPLTPMRDPDLVRVLGRQTARGVGLLPLTEVRAGADRLRAAWDALTDGGAGHVLVDAAEDADLDTLAEALLDPRAADRHDHAAGPDRPGQPARPRADAGSRSLVGGAAGLAAALARRRVEVAGPTQGATLPTVGAGRRLVVAGSCSERTREQVGHHTGPRLRIGAPELAEGRDAAVGRALAFVRDAWSADEDAVPLVYSTGEPQQVRAEQDAVGRERAAALVEGALGEVARRAVADLGARRVLVAGGETSGAVTSALGVRALHLGTRVAPGLAWTVSTASPHVALLLKSGNFGAPDLFTTAWETAP